MARKKTNAAKKRAYQMLKKQQRQKRVQDAVSLRLGGQSFDDIAAIMHINRKTAQRYVQDGLMQTATAFEKDAAYLRTMEIERLEAIWRGIYPKAIAGDLDAVDRCMRVNIQRTKLLGLDIDRVELVFDEQAMAAISEIIARVADARTAQLIQKEFSSFALMHGQRDLPMLPPEAEEGEFIEVSNDRNI